MEHSQVVTFFHEFGHLMHEVVGGQGKQFASFSGTCFRAFWWQARMCCKVGVMCFQCWRGLLGYWGSSLHVVTSNMKP